MKSEFDVLKTQISHIAGLTDTMDEKQHTQIEVYEEQVKQFSVQLAALNQTVEEMNQEILSISNKLIRVKAKKFQKIILPLYMKKPHANRSTGMVNTYE